MISLVAKELNFGEWQVEMVQKLFAEGGTLPFIARYRKEATGSLDEVQIAAIRDRLTQIEVLEKRKEAIIKSIEEQGKLTLELKSKIEQCGVLSQLEDLYLPYKPKRKTRASIAREKGLEPLALTILDQNQFPLDKEAGKYISEEKGVLNVEDALSGSRDIIAEIVNEHAETRQTLRTIFKKNQDAVT